MHGLKVQAHAKPEQNFPKSFEYGGYAFTSYAYFRRRKSLRPGI